jgi:hypothetical protein
MKLALEFQEFLCNVWTSDKSGMSMSSKAASDAASRVRRVERELCVEIYPIAVGPEANYLLLLSQIRDNRIGSTAMRPSGCNQLIYSVKLYREFAGWFERVHSKK